MSTNTYQYLFGPVPSRRLGRSLGVDIIPLQTCTQNCIYCQLGKDTPQTLERKEYAPITDVLAELECKLTEGVPIDTITIRGSGEPTLHSQLGELIDGIRAMTDIPVAVITNSSLLYRADVRADCAKADIVLPSLDAADPATFEAMNCPAAHLTFEELTVGLCRFAAEYTGKLWLEVFFCDNVNTDDASVAKLRELIARIAPDKVQINTAVRPTVHAVAARVPQEKLEAIAAALGDNIEVIADYSKAAPAGDLEADEDAIADMLSRRPCSLDDIAAGMGLNRNLVGKALTRLLDAGRITTEQKNEKTYYKPA